MSTEGQFAAKPLPAEEFRCPYCQAKRITTAAVPCWLCQGALPAHHGPMPKAVRSRGDNPALIFLGILALLIGLGLTIETPGVAIVVAIAVTPALVRAAVTTSRRLEAGQPMTGLEKVGAFLSSVGVVATVGVASFVAFFATCFLVCLGIYSLEPKGHGDTLLFVSIAAGLIPGVGLFILLLYKFWPRKERP